MEAIFHVDAMIDILRSLAEDFMNLSPIIDLAEESRGHVLKPCVVDGRRSYPGEQYEMVARPLAQPKKGAR